MSTPPNPVTAQSKTQTILAIINAALQGLSLVPGLQAPIALEQAFQKILTNALAAYQAETGQPIDLAKIPLETKV